MNVELTDLSVLYLSEAIRHSRESSITMMNFSSTNMQSRAGEFLGEALLSNPGYKIEKIKFKDVNLENNGLHRLLEAANANHNITRLHLGVVSDFGLITMSELLRNNTSLLRIEFQESKSICLHSVQTRRNPGVTRRRRLFARCSKAIPKYRP